MEGERTGRGWDQPDANPIGDIERAVAGLRGHLDGPIELRNGSWHVRVLGEWVDLSRSDFHSTVGGIIERRRHNDAVLASSVPDPIDAADRPTLTNLTREFLAQRGLFWGPNGDIIDPAVERIRERIEYPVIGPVGCERHDEFHLRPGVDIPVLTSDGRPIELGQLRIGEFPSDRHIAVSLNIGDRVTVSVPDGCDLDYTVDSVNAPGDRVTLRPRELDPDFCP